MSMRSEDESSINPLGTPGGLARRHGPSAHRAPLTKKDLSSNNPSALIERLRKRADWLRSEYGPDRGHGEEGAISAPSPPPKKRKMSTITAEVSPDPQHGPVVTVSIGETRVSVYLAAETGIVTTPEGRQYGLEVSGPWYAVRDQLKALAE